MTGAARADAEDDDDSLESFLNDLLDGEGSNLLSANGAGWILNMMLGNTSGNPSNPQPTPAQLQAALTAQSKVLGQIQTQINNLANQLTNAQYAIQAQLENNQYDTQVSAASSGIATIQGWNRDICEYNSVATQYGWTVSGLPTGVIGFFPYIPSPEDDTLINEIRDPTYGASGQLDDLSAALMGENGSQGIISIYRESFWATMKAATGATPSTGIWTGTYLTSMHALVDYYINLAVSLFNSYVEAEHWNDKAVPADSQAESHIGKVYSQLQKYLPQWQHAATGDLPALPANQAIDVRIPPGTTTPPTTHNQWTIAPTTLPATNAGQYCANPGGLCLFNEWLPDPKDALPPVGGRIVPNIEPLNSYLVGPWQGWHVPTLDDWTTLVAPSCIAPPVGGSTTGPCNSGTLAGVDPNAGVAAWATAEGIPILQGQNITIPGGAATTTIFPVVVSDPTHPTDEVLTFNDPSSAAPFAPTPGTGENYAGNLALETTITEAPLNLPAPPSSASGSSKPAAPAVKTPARPSVGPHTGTAVKGPAPRATAKGTVGAIGQTTSFTTPGTCSTNNYVQPQGANAVRVVVNGAAGGAGYVDPPAGNRGGLGGQITMVIPLQPNAQLHAWVGGAGSDAHAGSWNGGNGGFGNGGNGGGADGNTSQLQGGGGGGGGLSGISADSNCTQWIAVAGGGGGGGEYDGNNSYTNYGGTNACADTSCGPNTITDYHGNGQGRPPAAADQFPLREPRESTPNSPWFRPRQVPGWRAERAAEAATPSPTAAAAALDGSAAAAAADPAPTSSTRARALGTKGNELPGAERLRR